MSSSKKLHELCNELGVTRRTIQGYESAGLVSATGKNKYGHLLYDERAQERIVQILLYQRIGFKLREIRELIDAPDAIVKAAVEKQILHLKEERRNIDVWLEGAYRIIKEIENRNRE